MTLIYCEWHLTRMTYETHLYSISSAASQRLGILMNSGENLIAPGGMLSRIHPASFRVVLSALWSSAADAHICTFHYYTACSQWCKFLNCRYDHGSKNNTSWLDSAIRRRKKASNDVTASKILVMLRCCVWLLAEMLSFRAVFFVSRCIWLK